MLASPITASVLHSYIRCPHRVALDAFGDSAKRDPVDAFVELLWERGNAFESEVVESIGEPLVDLKDLDRSERQRLTKEAMEEHAPLIYGGRLVVEDMIGEPDVLRFDGGGYVAGDIKSGSGVEGGTEDSDGRPKQHYAVQLAFYTDVLRRMKLSGDAPPFIWDVHGDEVPYDLGSPRGKGIQQTMWEEFEDAHREVRAILSAESTTRPAYAAECKLCHWRTHCSAEVKALDDPSLVSGVGRKTRDKLLPYVATVDDLAAASPSEIDAIVASVDRLGHTLLGRYHARAKLQKTPDASPYLVEPVVLPSKERELFFDVETDPMRDICYLHGFVERLAGDSASEKYVAFMAERPDEEEERRAFAEAWDYVHSFEPTAMYYYSPYEKTTWRHLAERHPDVASVEDVNELFGCPWCFDLYYGLTFSKSMWPTHSLSIKELAVFLGFKWRDPEPSGAASIKWYHDWCETQDASVKQRILDYNEDDCVAMRWLSDAAWEFEVRE